MLNSYCCAYIRDSDVLAEPAQRLRESRRVGPESTLYLVTHPTRRSGTRGGLWQANNGESASKSVAGMAKDSKFGTFGGVYTPSVLTILGVIMYLRLPWVVGEAGLYWALAIVAIAHVISVTTGLSIARQRTRSGLGPRLQRAVGIRDFLSSGDRIYRGSQHVRRSSPTEAIHPARNHVGDPDWRRRLLWARVVPRVSGADRTAAHGRTRAGEHLSRAGAGYGRDLGGNVVVGPCTYSE